MLISVVIPLYNKVNYVVRCLESIKAQDYAELEIVIVDDGSTDGSAAEVEQWQRKNPNVAVSLIAQANAGVSVARNRGIDAAKGEWVALLDADDWWKPCCLSAMVATLSQYPDAKAVAVHYGFLKNGQIQPAKLSNIPDKQGYLDNYFKSVISGELPITASSVMIKRSTLNQLGGFPQGWSMGEDQWLWMQLARAHQIAFCNRLMAVYDLDIEASATKRHKVTTILPHVEALMGWITDGGLQQHQVPYAKKLVHRSLVFTALGCLAAGEKAQARCLMRNRWMTLNQHWVALALLSLLPHKLVKFVIERR